jgi:hypothetical protein
MNRHQELLCERESLRVRSVQHLIGAPSFDGDLE